MKSAIIIYVSVELKKLSNFFIFFWGKILEILLQKTKRLPLNFERELDFMFARNIEEIINDGNEFFLF